MHIWWSWMWGSGGSFELVNEYLGSKECGEFLDPLTDRYFCTMTAWIDVIAIRFACTRSINRSYEWPWPYSLSLLVTYIQKSRVLRSNINHPVWCAFLFSLLQAASHLLIAVSNDYFRSCEIFLDRLFLIWLKIWCSFFFFFVNNRLCVFRLHGLCPNLKLSFISVLGKWNYNSTINCDLAHGLACWTCLRMARLSSLSNIRISQITVYCQHIINISSSIQMAYYFNTSFVCVKFMG